MFEEMTGEAFEFVERLDVYEDYVPDLKSWDVQAETRALADLCLVLFNFQRICLCVLRFKMDRKLQKRLNLLAARNLNRRDFLYGLGSSIGSVALSHLLMQNDASASQSNLLAPKPRWCLPKPNHAFF